MGEIITLPPKPKYKDATSASIEAQVAVKGLVDLKIAGFEIPSDLEYAMWWWMREALKDHLGVLNFTKPKRKDEIDG